MSFAHRFEYDVEHIQNNEYALIDALNRRGADGWECFCMAPLANKGTLCYLKRAVLHSEIVVYNQDCTAHGTLPELPDIYYAPGARPIES